MISKQRGVIDPWTLGFLIGLTGITVVQPWDNNNNEATGMSGNEIKTSLVNTQHKLQTTRRTETN